MTVWHCGCGAQEIKISKKYWELLWQNHTIYRNGLGEGLIVAARARQRGSDLSFLSRPASQRKSTQGTTVIFAVETGPEPGGRQICCGSRCHVDIFNNEKRVNLIRIILGKVATMFVGAHTPGWKTAWSEHPRSPPSLPLSHTAREVGGGIDRNNSLFYFYFFCIRSCADSVPTPPGRWVPVGRIGSDAECPA